MIKSKTLVRVLKEISCMVGCSGTVRIILTRVDREGLLEKDRHLEDRRAWPGGGREKPVLGRGTSKCSALGRGGGRIAGAARQVAGTEEAGGSPPGREGLCGHGQDLALTLSQRGP